jgi:hypothetical protein
MHNFGVLAQVLLVGEVVFFAYVISKSWALQNGHVRQLLRDQPCASLGVS